MLSLELLAAVAGLNILFNLPVAVRRLHDSNLSGKIHPDSHSYFHRHFPADFPAAPGPGGHDPYLDYLGMVSSLMDLLSSSSCP